MYLTRAKSSKRIPIARKGTKYIARAVNNSRQGIPVVIAIRDMLNLARTAKEVNLMVKQGLLKINGRLVRDLKEGISLFNMIEADKKYKLIILKTGKFNFEETKDDFKNCKVIGKKILKGGKTQVNLHDGTNFLTNDKIKVGDSIHIGFDGKIKKIIPLEKGKEVFIISGRSVGNNGKIKDVSGKMVEVQMEDRMVVLNQSHLMAI